MTKEPPMDNENLKIAIEPIYGTVEIQSRMVPCNGGVAFQGRSIHKDENGLVTKTTEWETSGVLHG